MEIVESFKSIQPGTSASLSNQTDLIFSSRPRRFGKSLLLSAMKATREGKRELFKGLRIEALEQDNPEAWQPHPVFPLDFNRTRDTDKGMPEIADADAKTVQFILSFPGDGGRVEFLDSPMYAENDGAGSGKEFLTLSKILESGDPEGIRSVFEALSAGLFRRIIPLLNMIFSESFSSP